MSSEKVSRPLASDDAAMRDPTRTSDCAVQAQTQPQATAPPTVATDPAAAAAAAAAADPATGTVGTPPKPHERDKKKNAEEAATSTADEESGVVPEESPQQDATLTGYRLIAVAVGVCFGALMISVDISILGTALPSLMADLHDSPGNIAWYPAAFTLATCALTPVAGKMAAVFPLDLVYSASTLVFLVGSILCGWAPTPSAFIAGRAIAGVGAAGVASNGLTILVTIAPPKRKPALMGMGAACFAMGLVAGPLLGGAFTDRLTWRWCFWINIPFNAVTLAVVSLFFHPQQGRGGSVSGRIQSLDLLGCVIFVPGIFMFLLAMQMGGDDNTWNSPTVIGLFVGAGVTLLLFLAWERHRGDEAMIPGNVALRKTVIFTCLFAAMQMGGLTVASYYLPAWFQAIQGVGPLESGVRILPTALSQLVAAGIASGLALRIRYYNPWFFLAATFMCISSGLYTTFSVSHTSSSQWIGYQIIQGFGTGWGMQMSSLRVQLELKDSPSLVPVGIALVMFIQYLGATVIQIIAGTVFNTVLTTELQNLNLTASQKSALLDAGIKGIRIVAERRFPELLREVLEAYNTAITRVFFVPLASASAAFLFAFGIKWVVIEGAVGSESNKEPAAAVEGVKPGATAKPAQPTDEDKKVGETASS